MKSEQAAFGERLRAALRRQGLTESATELAGLLTRHGGVPVASQAISGWLNGKNIPRQANLRALAKLLRMDPYELQYGADDRKVQEGRADWQAGHAPRNVLDQHAIDAFLTLPAAQRKLVRALIEELAQARKK